MTQEDKDLLLKDLCARLPYGVICRYKNENRPLFCVSPTQYYKIALDNAINVKHNGVENCVIEEVKPYLFPLSSMTEEQKYDFYCRFIENDCDFNDFKEFYLDNNMWHKMLTSVDDCESVVDWYNKNHFDYRGLIPMDLANDATGLNIY